MIRLTYSNRSEALLDAWIEDLAAWRAEGTGVDPLTPIRVVVPNRYVEAWVKQGVARRMGIAANLEVLYLQRFVAGLFSEHRLLDAEAIHDGLLGLLLDEEWLATDEMRRLRSYLHAAGSDAAALDIRRHQLALQLARLFEEYGYSRSEMLIAWREGPTLVGSEFEETERWQRALWLELLRRSPEFSPLPDLLEGLGELDLGNERIHFFGVSYVANAFHRILARLAEGNVLFAYTLNPCREFWEDVETGREAVRRLARIGLDRLHEEDPFGLQRLDDNPALSIWGRPGRENIRLLNELAECDFEERFADPLEAGPSLLRHFQRDILHRAPQRGRADATLEADGSVEILVCPGVRREAEAIAEKIWSLLEADPSLRFNDIAVLVAGADTQAHFTHLAAAFEESYGIPYSRSDGALLADSGVAEALRLLLELPLGRFSRSEILGFLTHPAVGSRFAEALPEDWARLAEALGIFHGADAADLKESYLEEDLLSWDQGLRRLALGAFLGEGEPFELNGSAYLPAEGGRSEAEWAAMARSLIADLRHARDASLRPEEWARLFEAMARTYLRPRSEVEEAELERCLRAMRRLGEMELGGAAISCRLAVLLAQEELSKLPGGKGHYLAEGVVLSTLQPMRAIPFRHIFIAGLDEGRFPSPDKRNQLDLRLAKPRAGDVSPREGEQYMFLEALLCARDGLVLSYVGRDEQTGEALSPSPVLLELRRMLESGYLREPAGLERQIPLRRFEGGAASPQALREAQAAALRKHLRETCGAEEGALRTQEWIERAEPAVQPALRQLFTLHSVEEVEAEAKEEHVFTTTQLRKFLECPIQGSAQYALRLEDEEEDLRDKEWEPLETSNLVRATLLRGAFLEALRHGGDVEEHYERRSRLEALAGRMPVSFFQSIERDKHLQILQTWRDVVEEQWGGPLDEGAIRVLRFGPALEGEEVDELRPAVAFDGLRFVGRTEAHLEGRNAWLHLATGKAPKEADALRIFVPLLLAAAEGDVMEAQEAWIAPGEGKKLIRFAFQPIQPEEARKQLRILAEDLLAPPRDLYLPVEAVFEWRKKPEVGFAQHAERIRGNSRKKSYGPIRDLSAFRIPEEEEVEAIVERRFGLFFQKLVVEEKKRGGKR